MAEQDLTRPQVPHATHDAGPLILLRRLGPRAYSLGFLLALTLAEALTTLFEPRLGMLLHGLVFILLLLITALSARGNFQKFLFALSLAPLIRLLSLTMPLMGFPFIYWYMIVGVPLFLAVYAMAKLTRLGWEQLGLNLRVPVSQLLIAVYGIIFGLIEYVILRPEPLIDHLDLRTLWLPALILLVFTGFLEELIFRGVLQYTALRKFGRFGLWYVAAVFAVLHLGYRSLLDVLFVFIVALFFGWAVLKTGSIVGVTLSHGLTNVTLYLVIPFLFASPAAVSAPMPQDVLAAVPPLPSQVVNTPFQPLPSATFTALPTHTPTLPSPTPVPPTQTELPPTETALPTEAPLNEPVEPVYEITQVSPRPSPTATALPPIPTVELPTADPIPPNPPPSATATTLPPPSRTPENTPTAVNLPETPTVVPQNLNAASTFVVIPNTEIELSLTALP